MRTSIQIIALEPDVATAIAKIASDTRTKVRLLLELVGQTTITYLRSLTDELRPPVRKDRPARRAHPGHWADVTSQLALSYSYEVFDEGESVTLALRDTAAHAVFVDAKDGFFVLRGVADPGGIVEQALKRSIPIVAPGWTWKVA